MPNVLITGASSGIGLETTVELARRGWHVFATMRDTSRAASLRDALAEAGINPAAVEIMPLDVTDAASIKSAVATLLERGRGSLDAVVHNAGMSIAGAFEDFPDADVRRVMETNFFGVLALTRAILPTMRDAGRGRILIVSSEAAFFGLPANSIYSASKWALEGWAESLAFEVTPFGIEVILVEPGPFRTPIWQRTQRIRPAGSPYRHIVHQLFAAGDAHAARVAGDPADVARAISKILSATRPHFRNPVGLSARINHILRGKVPSRLLRRVIAYYLGISRITPRR